VVVVEQTSNFQYRSSNSLEQVAIEHKNGTVIVIELLAIRRGMYTVQLNPHERQRNIRDAWNSHTNSSQLKTHAPVLVELVQVIFAGLLNHQVLITPDRNGNRA
jgi:hypothetical protein